MSKFKLLPKLQRPDEEVADKGGDCLVFSMSIVWDDGTRTRPFKVPVRVESVPGGITWWPVNPDMATIPNPGHKIASGVWYYLNGVPWHFSEDWNWNNPTDNPVLVHFDGPVVDLS